MTLLLIEDGEEKGKIEPTICCTIKEHEG